jgi:hypothetical protein
MQTSLCEETKKNMRLSIMGNGNSGLTTRYHYMQYPGIKLALVELFSFSLGTLK